MASEAIKRILEAESEVNKKNAEARKRKDEIINNAVGNSALIIQKKIGEANAESNRQRIEYDKMLASHREKAEAELEKDLENLKDISEKNMSRTIDEIINSIF
ncbi:MAG: hypothetical protein J6I47_07580 [Ruminococcus sp.]|nr:hypothetical protein [Ruminococcus sp.]